MNLATNFFAAQAAEMKRIADARTDKHLLPIIFNAADKLMFANGIPSSVYSEIHLIFNHKNVWANLQNADPVKIRYELHDDSQWLPFVRDDTYPHRYDLAEDRIKFKQWQRFVDREKKGDQVEDDEDAGANKTDIRFETVDFRFKGEYLQAF